MYVATKVACIQLRLCFGFHMSPIAIYVKKIYVYWDLHVLNILKCISCIFIPLYVSCCISSRHYHWHFLSDGPRLISVHSKKTEFYAIPANSKCELLRLHAPKEVCIFNVIWKFKDYIPESSIIGFWEEFILLINNE